MRKSFQAFTCIKNCSTLQFSNNTRISAALRTIMSGRTYKDAIDCLNTLQSNAATLEAARLSGGRLAEFAMHETEEYLYRIGYTVSFNNPYNVYSTYSTSVISLMILTN